MARLRREDIRARRLDIRRQLHASVSQKGPMQHQASPDSYQRATEQSKESDEQKKPNRAAKFRLKRGLKPNFSWLRDKRIKPRAGQGTLRNVSPPVDGSTTTEDKGQISKCDPKVIRDDDVGINDNLAKAEKLHGSNYGQMTMKSIQGGRASISRPAIELSSGEKMQARPKLRIKLGYGSSRVKHVQHDKAAEDKIISQGGASVVKHVDQYHFVLDPHVSLLASPSEVHQQRLTTDLRSGTRKPFKVRFVQPAGKASNNHKGYLAGVEDKPEEVKDERTMSEQALDVCIRTPKARTDSADRLAHINDSNEEEMSDDQDDCNIEAFARDEREMRKGKSL